MPELCSSFAPEDPLMEKLFEFTLRTAENVFTKFVKNASLLLITAIAAALLFSPYIITKFPLSDVNYMACRAFLFILFFFFAYFCYLTVKKVAITPSNFFSLIGASNFNHSFTAILITVAVYVGVVFLFFLPEIVYAGNEHLQDIYLLSLAFKWAPVLAVVIFTFLMPIFIFTLFLVFEGDSFWAGLSAAKKICFQNKAKTFFLFFTVFLIGLVLNLVFVGQFITVQLMLFFMFQAIFEFKEASADEKRDVYLSPAAETPFPQTNVDETSFLTKPRKFEDKRVEFSSDQPFDGAALRASSETAAAAAAATAAATAAKTFSAPKPVQTTTPPQNFLPTVPGGTLKSVFKAASENIKPLPQQEPRDPAEKKDTPVFKPLPGSIDADNKLSRIIPNKTAFMQAPTPTQQQPKEETFFKPLPAGNIDADNKLSKIVPDKTDFSPTPPKEETSIGKSEISIEQPVVKAAPSYIKSDRITTNDNSAFIKKVEPKQEVRPQSSKNPKVGNVSEYNSDKTDDAPVLDKEKEDSFAFLDTISEGSATDDKSKSEKPDAPKRSSDILAEAIDKAESDNEREDSFDINVDEETENAEESEQELKNFSRPVISRPRSSKLELTTNFKEGQASSFVRKRNDRIDTSFGFSSYGSSSPSFSSDKKPAERKEDKRITTNKEFEITK